MIYCPISKLWQVINLSRKFMFLITKGANSLFGFSKLSTYTFNVLGTTFKALNDTSFGKTSGLA